MLVDIHSSLLHGCMSDVEMSLGCLGTAGMSVESLSALITRRAMQKLQTNTGQRNAKVRERWTAHLLRVGMSESGKTHPQITIAIGLPFFPIRPIERKRPTKWRSGLCIQALGRNDRVVAVRIHGNCALDKSRVELGSDFITFMTPTCRMQLQINKVRRNREQ